MTVVSGRSLFKSITLEMSDKIVILTPKETSRLDIELIDENPLYFHNLRAPNMYKRPKVRITIEADMEALWSILGGGMGEPPSDPTETPLLPPGSPPQ